MLEAAKQVGEWRYSQSRSSRKVKKVTPSWPPEVQVKYKGIAEWERIDLACLARKYDTPCTAKRVVDRRIDTLEIIHIDDSEATHIDHDYKKRARPDANVLQRAHQLAASGVPPAQAEEILAREALAEAVVPVEGGAPKRNRT